MKILRARLYELERNRIDQERSKDRKTKIGTGDRSERIRTYDFPVSYTHLRAHETSQDLVCRLLLEKKKIKRDLKIEKIRLEAVTDQKE